MHVRVALYPLTTDIQMRHGIPIDVQKKLAKKWKSIITRYSNYRDAGWKRVFVRGNTTVTVDLSKTKDFYESQIKLGNDILEGLGE